MRKVIFLAAVFSFIPLTLHAVETMNSVYVDGVAPIVVDGDLSDWAFVTSGPVPMTNTMLNWWQNKPDSEIPRKGPEDLSGSFQCFYDTYNLYIAVNVRDDEFVSGREPFSFNLFDDCVEITYSGDSEQWLESKNFGRISFFADYKSGKTFGEMGAVFQPLETVVSIMEWENLGLRGVLKQNDQGYTVEVSIPYLFLGWTKFEPNHQMGLNIKINDVDKIGKKNCALIWAQDSNPDELQWHNIVSFNTSVVVSKDSQPVSDSDAGGKNIVAVLGDPDETQSVSNLINVYRAYSKKDYIETERLLNLCSKKDKYWSKMFLGFLRFDTKNYSESGQILESLADESPDLCLSRKALYQAGRAYMRAGDKMKAIDIFSEVLLSGVELHGSMEFVTYGILGESIAELIKNEPVDSPIVKKKDEIVDQFVEAYNKNIDSDPNDMPFNFQLVKRGLNGIKAYNSSFKLLEKIGSKTSDQKTQSEAKLERARSSFFNGDYELSKQLGNELVNSSDPKIQLDAQMILLSIERNLYGKNK